MPTVAKAVGHRLGGGGEPHRKPIDVVRFDAVRECGATGANHLKAGRGERRRVRTGASTAVYKRVEVASPKRSLGRKPALRQGVGPSLVTRAAILVDALRLVQTQAA